MNPLFRSAGTIVLAVLIGGGVIALCEWISQSLLVPPEVDLSAIARGGREAVEAAKALPPAAIWAIVVVHAIGSLVVGLVAALMADRWVFLHVVVAVAVLMMIGLANLVMIPIHPPGFAPADVLALGMPGTFVGWLISRLRRRGGNPPEPSLPTVHGPTA